MKAAHRLLLAATLSLAASASAANAEIRRPHDGDHALRILDPRTLELELVSRKPPGQPMPYWDAVGADGLTKLPDPDSFTVLVNGEASPNRAVKLGYKRRPCYAPLGEHDLRVATQIYLMLAAPLDLHDGDRVEVKLPATLEPPQGAVFAAEFSDQRVSPVIHINQVGYQTGAPKQALVGYYLGDAGELDLGDVKMFHLRDIATNKKVFSGPVKRIRDVGLPFAEPQYQRVLTLDFSAFDTPGNYVINIGPLGDSMPFTISDGLYACIARTYALGLYHQRSGVAVGPPYSRFAHKPSHTRPVRIPEEDDPVANELVAGMADKTNKDQIAPELNGYADSLYPIVNRGTIGAVGGHHDAGDYSKYTTNCAQLIHHLMFANDALPGVSRLDNLGLPESGDGTGDLLQIALNEAKFLAELQDSDGGFFFLVYPEDRKYEDDVAPDGAGGQIVFPKNTAATAAATAALAQIGSSLNLQAFDKASASRFLLQAERGWQFLERAWEKHGRDGAYQRISHYGDIFMDRDEIIWAATELYLATKDQKYHAFLLDNYKPAAPETRRWGWQRLFEGYGAAARSYAYARMSGRAGVADLDPAHFRACQQEVWGWGKELTRYADESAYGLSFPGESKAFKAAGWYFPISDTLDLVAAAAQSETRELDRTILTNINYELGANPTNTCFLTGLGYKRRFEIVHQWARNDEFVLPMSGIPVGSLVAGVPWIGTYERELGSTIYPGDDDPAAPFAFYDRITDTFDVATEFVTYQQGRALAAAAYLMARTDLAKQPYKHLDAVITGTPTGATLGSQIHLSIKLTTPRPDLADALIVWEARGVPEPHTGREFSYVASDSGPCWATVEAQWPDGRRAFGRTDFPVTAGNAAAPLVPTGTTAFYFSADSPALAPGTKLRSGKARTNQISSLDVSVRGTPSIDNRNLLWMRYPRGGAIRFDDFDDAISFQWEDRQASSDFVVSAWFYFEKFPHSVTTANLFGIGRDSDNQVISLQFDKWAKPIAPQLIASEQGAIGPADLADVITLKRWQKLEMRVTSATWQLSVDGKPVGSGALIDPERVGTFFAGTARNLSIGHFIGLADELHVSATTP